MAPSLSPGADRLVYSRIASDSNVDSEYAATWSPDAKSFAYLRHAQGKLALAIAKTSGEATPVVIRQGDLYRLPDWSPDGQWILATEKNNNILISPDGKTIRELGEFGDTVQLTFSKDSRLLYGIRRVEGRPQLFSVDIATKNVKVIGEFDQELYPSSYLNPGIRLSLSPDGKNILFPSITRSSSLWMLEGFDPPSWTERLRERLPW